MNDRHEQPVQTVIEGAARGRVLALSEPLSLWGGLEPMTGLIIDQQHPERGHRVTDTILVMPTGRGSSSASSVLAECIRLRTAPAAFVLSEQDHVLTIGALAARELYDRTTPIVVATSAGHALLSTGMTVAIADGSLTYVSEPIE